MRYRYFQCIKRQYKNPNNCTAKVRVEKFEEGEKNMIVIPKGKPHNHDQGSSNFIRKEVNTELKKMALKFPKTKPNIIVQRHSKPIVHFVIEAPNTPPKM